MFGRIHQSNHLILDFPSLEDPSLLILTDPYLLVCSDFLFVHGLVIVDFTVLGIYLSPVGDSLRQHFLGALGPQPRDTGSSSQVSAGSTVGTEACYLIHGWARLLLSLGTQCCTP